MRLAFALGPLLLAACGDFGFNVHTDPRPPEPPPSSDPPASAPPAPPPPVDDAGIAPAPGDIAI